MNAQARKKKENLVQEALDHLDDGGKDKWKAGKKLSKTFVEQFCRQLPPEDMEEWESDELTRVVRSILDWGLERRPGQHQLRVYNPRKQTHGWYAPRTVIEIYNDDMPFLIDSIAAELAGNGMTIEVLLHPILRVERDDDNKIEKIYTGERPTSRGIAESCIHIQLEQLLPEKAREKLVESLNRIIQDVRLATGDWLLVLGKLEDAIQDMNHLPRDLNPEHVAEAQAFLKYVYNNNFTLLGCRQYKYAEKNGKLTGKIVPNSGLGLLRDDSRVSFASDENQQELKALVDDPAPVLVSKLIDEYSTVHRAVPMDAISVKTYDKQGNVSGQHLFVGLFTSSTYSCRTVEVPLVRQKVQETLRLARFGHDSHDRKALEHILEKYPRDELFQASVDEMVDISLGILRLQERQRTALFTRMDPLGRYMSCLVYVPRDRFDTKFRMQAGEILERSLGGKLANFYSNMDDSPLARVLFTILIEPGKKPEFDHDAVENELIDLGRDWYERLGAALIDMHGKTRGVELEHRYNNAFPAAYQDQIRPSNAVHDIRHIGELNESDHPISMELYKLTGAPENELRLKIYHKDTPVPLSDIMPILGHMGLNAISETPFEIRPTYIEGPVWIHDFVLRIDVDGGIDLPNVKDKFEEALLQIWLGNTEDDGLNELVLKAALDWREVMILRTYTGFLRQARYPFSRRYIEQVLSLHAGTTQRIVALFKARLDPENRKSAEKEEEKIRAEIDERLQQVEKLDHDRILRSYRDAVSATLRTNFYQTDEKGVPKTCLAVKLNSAALEELPRPRPHVEIYVYSPRVEAVHLRGGEIARGGIRWSDRHDDFRTEVLGLMKAQMVKNAVIVPVGAKGGFIVKQPPTEGGRTAVQQEGIECYKIFIRALLDLTDNNVKGKVVKPKDTVCHDGDDPYLVVAADKGTATFSDIANSLSDEAGFWLDDAFASGGSAGYDHKEMGITARGAWESVKRHFRELGKDIQSEDFTVIGVGDMGGDVFGNGMLLSKHIRLLGAFNHIHIFCDPDPDAAKSFAERKRLFRERGGWTDYDTKKLSKGGKVYDRSAKSLKLTPEIRKCFGLTKDNVTPDELIRAMLKAETELLWLGGIGTYVKSSRESHADADDKANDSLRVNGRDLNFKVVGEGANLGFTQLGRVEFAQRGGMINTDFIDNSAGVDCSDHEVNIKILLSAVEQKKKMKREARNELLEEMTEDVASLVLVDNYQQSQALSVCRTRAVSDMQLYANFIRDLERGGHMERALEGLPDDETIQQMQNNQEGLSRPELAVLLSYSKIRFYQDLLESRIPDEKPSHDWLVNYFPDDLRDYAKEIDNHKLKREIIATGIANVLTNRMGPVFVKSRMNRTGATPADVARSFMIVVESFGMHEIWDSIEKLDNKVGADVQLDALNIAGRLIKHSATWLLRHGDGELNLEAEIKKYKQSFQTLKDGLQRLVPTYIRENMEAMQESFIERGMPKKLAARLAAMPVLNSACDIVNISRDCDGNIEAIAECYFRLGERLRLDWIRHEAGRLTAEDHWDARVLSNLMDDLYVIQAELTAEIITTFGCPLPSKKAKGKKKTPSVVDSWMDENMREVAAFDDLLAELRNASALDTGMLVLAGQRLRQLV